MNTKWLLLLILTINVVTLIYGTQICSSFNSDSLGTQAIDFFYDYSFLKSAYQQCRTNQISGLTGPNASGLLPTGNAVTFANPNATINATFGSTTSAATQASTGSVGSFSSGSTGFAFLDLIKLVISFCAMLVGLPVMTILSALGVNGFVVWVVIPVIETLFVIGVIEFLRGSSF